MSARWHMHLHNRAVISARQVETSAARISVGVIGKQEVAGDDDDDDEDVTGSREEREREKARESERRGRTDN